VQQEVKRGRSSREEAGKVSGLISALIWTVFLRIRGPVGKSCRESYDGDFLPSSSEQMSGFCHSLRQKECSLLVLFELKSDSLTSLIILSIYPSLVKVMQVSRS
jgi:hypothetical protein